MKLNWTGIGAVIASLAVVLGWAWSIEHRLGQATDVSGRLRSIEEALFPVLIDYKVNQLLREHGHTYGSLERPTAPLAYAPPGGDGVFDHIAAPIEAPAPAEAPDPPPPPRPVYGPSGGGVVIEAPAPTEVPAEYPREMIQQQAETWARGQLSLE